MTIILITLTKHHLLASLSACHFTVWAPGMDLEALWHRTGRGCCCTSSQFSFTIAYFAGMHICCYQEEIQALIPCNAFQNKLQLRMCPRDHCHQILSFFPCTSSRLSLNRRILQREQEQKVKTLCCPNRLRQASQGYTAVANPSLRNTFFLCTPSL